MNEEKAKANGPKGCRPLKVLRLQPVRGHNVHDEKEMTRVEA